MKRTPLKKPTLKKCPICKEKKPPFPGTVCSYECSIKYMEAKKEKDWKQQQKEGYEKLKTWIDYYQETLEVFNEYIRIRDKDKPCISCDAPPGTYRISSGHFHPQGTYKSVALNEDNAHGQCWFNCNKNKHGNLSEYRPRLIKRIGIERVEEIDRLKNTDFKASIPDLISIKVHYRKKIKALKKLND